LAKPLSAPAIPDATLDGIAVVNDLDHHALGRFLEEKSELVALF
jgi:hypothetical protein